MDESCSPSILANESFTTLPPCDRDHRSSFKGGVSNETTIRMTASAGEGKVSDPHQQRGLFDPKQISRRGVEELVIEGNRSTDRGRCSGVVGAVLARGLRRSCTAPTASPTRSRRTTTTSSTSWPPARTVAIIPPGWRDALVLQWRPAPGHPILVGQPELLLQRPCSDEPLRAARSDLLDVQQDVRRLRVAAKQQWGSQGIWIPETSFFNGLATLPEISPTEMRELYLMQKPWDQHSEKFEDYAYGMLSHNSRWNWMAQDGQWELGRWIPNTRCAAFRARHAHLRHDREDRVPLLAEL